MLSYTDTELHELSLIILNNKQDRKQLFRAFLGSLINLPYGKSSNNDIHIFFTVEEQKFNLWPTTMRAYQETLTGGRKLTGAYDVLKALNELNGEV